MKLKISILFTTLLIISNIVYSQSKDKQDKIDQELSQCLNKSDNQTTAGMCNCTYKALDEWDDQLNATYKLLLSKLDSSARSKLIDAQREWIKFKEKEIALVDATYGQANGTMWIPVRAEKVLDITKQRTIDLKALLSALDEF
jgi:uncharacterized protein YecT (DUF1311 family)